MAKHYENDYLQNFVFLLMLSLTAPTESRFLLALFKKRSKTNLKPF